MENLFIFMVFCVAYFGIALILALAEKLLPSHKLPGLPKNYFGDWE